MPAARALRILPESLQPTGFINFISSFETEKSETVAPSLLAISGISDGNISGSVSEDGDKLAFTFEFYESPEDEEEVSFTFTLTNTEEDFSDTVSAALKASETADCDAGESFSNSLGMDFVAIQPGTFMMGSPASEPGRYDDETRHQVTLTKCFYMQTTEVTQSQWTAVMGSNPSYFSGCGSCPVDYVSWDDVQTFISKMNQRGEGTYRLPTEAEWEYAARAGTTTPFYFGTCLSTSQANYNGNYPLEGCSEGIYREKTLPVARFSPNSWGLYDMHGNVWEWCQDWYGDYPSGSVTDPAGPGSGSVLVVRGGSWDFIARDCRSASRGGSSPAYRGTVIGFRLVLPAGQPGR